MMAGEMTRTHFARCWLVLACTLVAFGQDTSDPGREAPADPVLPDRKAAPAASTLEDQFNWRSAVAESLIFTGVMHAHRFATEAGTRDALHGKFWADYMHSVGALRGWDDGDGFFTSYVGHPMEGSVFGFLEVLNDPRYRAVTLGDGRDYWISRLRALAFAAAMSTQWTLGPMSEASLGNVQLHASPGFVDLAGTPTLGVMFMIGEDAIDRHVIVPLEDHTANRALLVLVRCFGNPTRAFANVLSFRRPWQRYDRGGLFGSTFRQRAERVRLVTPNQTHSADGVSAAATHPSEAPIELKAAAHYETFLGGGSCIGGGATGSARISPSWQVAAELSGCLVVNMPSRQSGDSLLYAIGPRWTPRAGYHLSPYAHLLFGGRKLTHETLDPALRDQLQSRWDAGALDHYPLRDNYSVTRSVNGFALLAGGGLDVSITSALAFRAANLEYTRSFLPTVDRIDASQGLRFSIGLVLRIGTW
jgi:hypothetical protein